MRRATALAFALALVACRAMRTPPSVHTDAQMGIQAHSFPLLVPPDAGGTDAGAYELRVYLRAICRAPPDGSEASGSSSSRQASGGGSSGSRQPQQEEVDIKGFAGAFPVTGSEPTGLSLFSPHFQPPAVRQHKLHITSSVGGRAGGNATGGSSSTVLRWLGPANQGLWRFEGRLRAPTGREVLALEGSPVVHQLLLRCGGPLAGALGPARGSAFPTSGLWNVVTTTSANRLPPATLAHLLQLHVDYHARLGFAGAVLRCNKGEAQALASLPHVEALVAAGRLVLWPWVHEHSTGHTPFFWQKPRNQLTLLAGAAAPGLRLAFLDLDEYLVLPDGGRLPAATCGGRPLLELGGDRGRGGGAPALSFARYSARVCPAAPTDLACWLDGAQRHAGGTAAGNGGARPLPLLLERCPCRFHKPLLSPGGVTTMSVHFVWPGRGRRVADVPHACGFILHLHALVAARQHFMPPGLAADHLGAARWTLPAGGVGSARVTMAATGASVGAGNATSWLHGVATCGALRTAAGEAHDARFSVC